jgi:nuclear GTP-binding protein
MDAPVLAIAPDATAVTSNDGPVVGDQKEIVTEWAAEFKLEGLWGNGKDEVEVGTMQE